MGRIKNNGGIKAGSDFIAMVSGSSGNSARIAIIGMIWQSLHSHFFDLDLRAKDKPPNPLMIAM